MSSQTSGPFCRAAGACARATPPIAANAADAAITVLRLTSAIAPFPSLPFPSLPFPLFFAALAHLLGELRERRAGLRGVLRLVPTGVAACEHVAHLRQRSNMLAVGGALGRR